MFSKRLIFKTSDNDEIFYLNNTILINFNKYRNGISTSALNGGNINLYKSVFNQHLSQNTIVYLENHDLKEYLINQCNFLNIDSKYSTGLVTLAEMKNVGIVSKRFKSIEVTAIVTAGVRTNASRAGDPASYWEEGNEFHFGTINIILLTNASLGNDVLIEALMTLTEAKTVSLDNLRIPSQYSNNYATGTGTDGICIFSNVDSEHVITNAGKHSKFGELIANSVIEAISKAILKQVCISNKSQSNVLVRLSRYKLDINKFYDNLNYDKKEFIKQLQRDIRNQNEVALTSTILNLIDEVNCNLIKKEDAFNLAQKIIKENSNSYPIKELLNYWLNYFIQLD